MALAAGAGWAAVHLNRPRKQMLTKGMYSSVAVRLLEAKGLQMDPRAHLTARCVGSALVLGRQKIGSTHSLVHTVNARRGGAACRALRLCGAGIPGQPRLLVVQRQVHHSGQRGAAPQVVLCKAWLVPLVAT